MERSAFSPLELSLADLVGGVYVKALCRARASLAGAEEAQRVERRAHEKIAFFPDPFAERLARLLPSVGKQVVCPLRASARGATSAAFQEHSNIPQSPLSGLGYFRVGEGGQLRLIAKSEHYHAALGHGFPGHELLRVAMDLGVSNATHNNTRGHITRLLEQELLRVANGLPQGADRQLNALVASSEPRILNRVLNLETGSLAVEAALKMALARFHQIQTDWPHPQNEGSIPVVVVLGDDEGGLAGNYHGTTVLAQLLRGMWPAILEGMEQQGLLFVRTVRPNRVEDLRKQLDDEARTGRRVAAMVHEFIMMNYGARRLEEGFVREMYRICAARDIPVIADEIQSCLWNPGLFAFREYGVHPDFVAVGKGFPAGQFAASRVLFSARMDSLPQFGALVTNGQEELSSLAYLISIRWAEANADVIEEVGDRYHQALCRVAERFPKIVQGVAGCRHLSAVVFHRLEQAQSFVRMLDARGVDISVQSYKAVCPPVALTKLPLIAGHEVVDFLIDAVEDALYRVQEE